MNETNQQPNETNQQSSVEASLSAMVEQLKTLFNAVKEIKDMLHGDGKTGLISRVTALETKLDDKKEHSNNSNAWIAWLITTLIAAYAAFIKNSN